MSNQIKIGKERLSKTLGILKYALDRRVTLPILQYIFMKTNGKELVLKATDMDLSFEATIPIEGQGDWSITVPGRKFIDTIQSFPTTELTLETTNNSNRLWVRAKDMNSEQNIQPSDGYPELPTNNGKLAQIKLPIQKLKEAIGLASIAVSRDTTKPTMAAVLLHIQKTNIRLVSTDGFRLAIAEIPCETKINEEVKLVVPRRALDLFPQLLTNEGEVVIAWDATTLYIDQPGLKFSTRLVNGNFPAYEKVIPQELPKKVLIDRDLLSKRLRFVGLKKDDYNKNVQLVFAYPNLKIVFQHPDEGTNQSTLPFSGEEQAFELAFNIDYLTEILDRLTGEDVVYQFKDEIGQGIFTSPSIEGFVFRYILMPVRFANPTPA
ncbi:MAG: DNA polymerase III subunit beta [Holophagaceae bacterium]